MRNAMDSIYTVAPSCRFSEGGPWRTSHRGRRPHRGELQPEQRLPLPRPGGPVQQDVAAGSVAFRRGAHH